jgi:hypothetical protein
MAPGRGCGVSGNPHVNEAHELRGAGSSTCRSLQWYPVPHDGRDRRLRLSKGGRGAGSSLAAAENSPENSILLSTEQIPSKSP